MESGTATRTGLQAQQAESRATEPPEPTSAKHSLFSSFPPEIRCQIYGYLIPTRIFVAIDFTDSYKSGPHIQNIHPWVLERVSRQFSSEIRKIIFANTVFDFRLWHNNKGLLQARKNYETWIGTLREGDGASIKHLALDDLVEIDWKPDGPVPERPQDQAMRENQKKRALLVARYVRAETLSEPELSSLNVPLLRYSGGKKEVTVGNWALRCSAYLDNTDIYRLEFALQEIEKRRQQCGAVAGLGKAGIRELVDAYLEEWVETMYMSRMGRSYGRRR
ncbi:MAG: hypothetical protein Q9226_007790 [Calogaya cf. arnoldii]